MKFYIAFFCLICMLPSCTTHNYFQESKRDRKVLLAKTDSSFSFDPGYEYIIRKDDKISISIWGHDDLSVGSTYGIYNSNEVYGKWLLVDAKGNIEVPKVGTTKVLGKTIIEVKRLLKSKFQTWVINPVIDIKVLNKEITILGEVRNPGVIKVDKDHNYLLEIIARAGGTEQYANLKFVKVLRQEGEHVRVAAVNLNDTGNYLMKNLQLYPGDVVIIPSKSHKEFDKRVSTIIPFTTTITAAAILMGTF